MEAGRYCSTLLVNRAKSFINVTMILADLVNVTLFCPSQNGTLLHNYVEGVRRK